MGDSIEVCSNRQNSERNRAVPTDVRQSDQISNMVQKALEEFGRIDVLINNAGGSFVVMAMDMSENAWDAIVRENLKPVFLCSEIVGKVKLPEEVVILQLRVMHQQVLTGLQTMEKGTFSGNTDSTPNVWYNQRNQFSVPVLITLI